MKREHFETGVLRLFYVAWAIAASVALIRGVDMAVNDDLFHYGIDVVIATAFGAFLFPPIAMLAVRWVYRGFFPR